MDLGSCIDNRDQCLLCLFSTLHTCMQARMIACCENTLLTINLRMLFTIDMGGKDVAKAIRRINNGKKAE